MATWSLRLGYQAHGVLDLRRKWKETHKKVSVSYAGHSHLPCLLADLSRNSEDVGGFFHDPDEQVVDVVLQLANLELLLVYCFLLFEDQLDQLIMGELRISKSRVRGGVFLWRGKKRGKT